MPIGGSRGCRASATPYSGAVEGNHGRTFIGAVLGLAVAAGFELELAWLFIGAAVLFLAWLGFMLLGPEA